MIFCVTRILSLFVNAGFRPDRLWKTPIGLSGTGLNGKKSRFLSDRAVAVEKFRHISVGFPGKTGMTFHLSLLTAVEKRQSSGKRLMFRILTYPQGFPTAGISPKRQKKLAFHNISEFFLCTIGRMPGIGTGKRTVFHLVFHSLCKTMKIIHRLFNIMWKTGRNIHRKQWILR